MSSHQRAAGTRQWKTRVTSSGRRSLTVTTIGSVQSGQAVSIRPSTCRGGADPERVPGAVRKPVPAGGVDAKRRSDGRERRGHQELPAPGVEHERVAGVETFPTGPHAVHVEAARLRHLGRSRRAPEPDEQPVGGVAELEVRVVHAGSLSGDAR
jgi:hypothetical protein